MTPRSLISFIALISISGASLAGEKEQDLIDKITQAYGGKAFSELKSYRIVDHFLAPTTGQSHTPSLMEVSSSKQQADFAC